MKVILRNHSLEFVEIEEAAASSQFSVYPVSNPTEATNSASNLQTTVTDDTTEYVLEARQTVLTLIQYFSTQFHATKKSITAFSSLTEKEVEKLEETHKAGFLAELYDVSFVIGFENMKKMCAAFYSEKIYRIASMAEDPLSGAEEIRKYLGMDNLWTEDEMAHLREEMNLAMEVEPMAY